MLEKHIIIDGKVKTQWGDGSVVEAAIIRESAELRAANLKLMEDNASLQSSNRVLQGVRDESAAVFQALRDAKFAADALIVEYEDIIAGLELRIECLQGRKRFENTPLGPTGTVITRAKATKRVYDPCRVSVEYGHVTVRGSTPGHPADLTEWESTGEREMITDVFRSVPGDEI